MSEQTQHRLDTETTQPADFATIKMTKENNRRNSKKKHTCISQIFPVLKIQNQTEGIQQMRATKKQTYFTMNAEILKQLDCNGKDMKISCNEFTN